MDWTRILLILGSQLIVACFLAYLSYKILKRKRNQSTLYLSLAFFMEFISLALNAIIIFLELSYLVIFLYHFIIFLLYIGILLINLFLITFFKEMLEISLKKQIIIILVYSFIIISMLIFSDGVSFIEDPNWRPIWSPAFSLLNVSFLTFFYLIPFLFNSYHLFKKIINPNLRRRLMYFFFGTLLFLLQSYGVVLYISWNNSIFRAIWSLFSLVLILSQATLLYLGVGREY